MTILKTLKFLLFSVLLIAILLYAAVRYFQSSIQPSYLETSQAPIKFKVERLTSRPIIHPEIHTRLIAEAKEYGYTNINGPSLIKVPNWVENKLGHYYLYFAHHKGSFIRLAYADSLQGPWTMAEQEIMPLAKAGLATNASPALSIWELKNYLNWTELFAMMEVGQKAKKAWEARTKQKLKSSPPTTPHVASPEILIDEVNKQIRLYYHGVAKGNLQMSKVALSKDGINFTPESGLLGVPYLRIFPYQSTYYGLGMPGFFYRSKNGLSNFEVRKKWLFDTNVRHSAIYRKGQNLYIFYSKVGDQPEQILCSKVDISSADWNDWTAEPPQRVLHPELEWEGANLPIEPSMRGEMGVSVNQLRDPAIYEENGQIYLLYTGAGEQAIGIGKLEILE